jgi:hypothetical protein
VNATTGWSRGLEVTGGGTSVVSHAGLVLLREGPDGDQLKGWPKTMRVFARRERPHPGAQPSLFETVGGWRYSLWATNPPADTRGWRGQYAYADARPQGPRPGRGRDPHREGRTGTFPLP